MLIDELEISSSVSSKEGNHSLGPGSRLSKIREAKHLTINEMAKRIRLTPERLTQIESDNYLHMGAPAFAKGYLRAYANQLGVAQKEILTILKAFDDLGLGADIQHKKPELIHEKIDQNSPKMTRWVSYLIVALLLVVLGYLGYRHFNTLDKSGTTDKLIASEASLPNSSPTSKQPSELEALPIQAVSTEPNTTVSEEATSSAKAKSSSKNREARENQEIQTNFKTNSSSTNTKSRVKTIKPVEE